MPQLTWLVTGCSSGLGETLVKTILSRGDAVIATSRGDISRISSLAEAGAKTYSLDVTDSQSEINGTVAETLKEGPIDVLVNSAGYIEAGLAEEARFDLESSYINHKANALKLRELSSSVSDKLLWRCQSYSSCSTALPSEEVWYYRLYWLLRWHRWRAWSRSSKSP